MRRVLLGVLASLGTAAWLAPAAAGAAAGSGTQRDRVGDRNRKTDPRHDNQKNLQMPSIIEPNSTLSQLDRQLWDLTREHGHVLRLDEFRRHLDEHEQVLMARHVPPPSPPRAQPDPEAAGEAERMRQLQAEIARRLERGDTLDTVERELIAPSGMPEEQQSALWLFAWSHPKRPALSKCQPRLFVWAALANALLTLIGIDRY
jgi:hypothetical protein